MLEKRGMVFAGFDFSQYADAYPSRPIMPPISRDTRKIPGRQGSRFVEASFDEMPIKVKLQLKSTAVKDVTLVRHQLASMLWVKEPQPLILGDDPTRYYLCTLDGTSDLSNPWNTAYADLLFKAPDPIAYGETRVQNLGAGGYIQVIGTWETKPTLTITGASGQNVTISHTNTGDTIKLDVACNGTQTIVVDCEHEHCTINGASADGYLDLLSDYFILAPGINTLTVSSGSISVEWTERWV